MNDDLPEGWVTVSVGDVVAQLKYGTAKKCSHQKQGVPVLRIPNVVSGIIDHTDLKYATLPPAELEGLRLCPGDILVIRSNGSVSLVGRSALVQDRERGFAYAGYLIRLRLTKAIQPEFLNLALGSYQTRLQIELEARSTSGVNNINAEEIRALPIALPPLCEQRRIVTKIQTVLAAVRSAQERLDRILPILKRFRQAILAAACDGRLTANWRKEQNVIEPASAFLENVDREKVRLLTRNGRVQAGSEVTPSDETLLPDTPEGWAWATVDQLATKVVDGVHRKPDYAQSGVPFLTVRNLTAGRGISFASLSYVTRADHQEFSKRANPERGDILVTKDGTLGVVRVVDTDAEFSIFVSLALIKPVIRTFGRYLALALSSPQIHQRIVVTGTGLQHIHLRDLRAVPIPIPPASEQDEIVRRADAMFALADRLQARYDKAKAHIDKLTQSILARAFRGELVPTEAELAKTEGRSYETAAQLLERIKGQTTTPTETPVRKRATRA